MKKKLTSLLLAVVLAVTMLPVTALADEPQTPDNTPQNAETVTIDGTVLTDGMGWNNDGTTTENGSKNNNAYFKDGTLYLTDLELETSAPIYSILVSDGSITVTLTGENYINAQENGQYAAIKFSGDPETGIGTGTVTINGGGSLDITSDYAGISAGEGKTVNITDVSLSVISDWFSLIACDGSITDSLLVLECDYIPLAADALTMRGCIAALSGNHAGLRADTLDVRESMISVEGDFGALNVSGNVSFADSMVELYSRYGDEEFFYPAIDDIDDTTTVNLNGMQARAGETALDAKLVSDFESNFGNYSYALIADDPDSYMEWENIYDDIAEGKWYYDAVAYASQYGLMNGVGNDRFNPNGKVSRSQAVQMMYNLHTEYPRQYYVELDVHAIFPNPSPVLARFSDVPEGAWYEDAVLWGGNSGVVSGVGNNKFNPNGNVTREQFATILYNVAKKLQYTSNVSGNLNQFKDAKQVSSWAKNAVQWAVGAKIINGDNRKMLNPNGTLTRAEAAAMLRNFVGATLGV